MWRHSDAHGRPLSHFRQDLVHVDTQAPPVKRVVLPQRLPVQPEAPPQQVAAEAVLGAGRGRAPSR